MEANLLDLVNHLQHCCGIYHPPLPPFQIQSWGGFAGFAVSRQHPVMHPQMLRLDQFAPDDQQQSTEANPAAAAGLPLSDLPAQRARKAKLLPFSLQLKADDWLVDLGLMGDAGPSPAGAPSDLLMDLNDPGMTFEVLRGTEVEKYANAAAVILPAMPKVRNCADLHTLTGNTASTFVSAESKYDYTVSRNIQA